jgi:D-3-phosphoglycerate dehydrogenase
MKVSVTDMRHSSIEEERRVLEPAGVVLDTTFSESENELIANGRVAYYGADVFWQEPAGFSDPSTLAFLRRRNVLVSTHMSWYSEYSEREVRRKAAEEILRVLQGTKPLHPISS